MTDESIYVETAPYPQDIECPHCGVTVENVLIEDEMIGGHSCDACHEMIEFRFERQTESDEDDTEQTTLVTDGGRSTGALERFAIDQALRAAWDTEWWLPFDPEYGFIEYFEAAVTRNLGLLRGFEELAEDVERRGILPQTDSEQAQLVTDGGVPDPDAFRIPTIEELDAMRADANLSMRDLSSCAGFKDDRFSHILNNDVNPQTRTIRAFLTALQEFDGHPTSGAQGPDPSPSEQVSDDGPTEVDVEQIAARLERLNAEDVGEDPAPPEGDETLITDGGTAAGDSEYEAVFPIEVSKGDDVGECPECGPVVRENVKKEFPVATCGICGTELHKTTVASHDTRITQPRGAQ